MRSVKHKTVHKLRFLQRERSNLNFSEIFDRITPGGTLQAKALARLRCKIAIVRCRVL